MININDYIIPTKEKYVTNSRTTNKKLGEILLGRHLITEKELEAAIAISKKDGLRVGEALLNLKAINPEDLTSALSYQMNVPIVDVKKIAANPEAIDFVSEDVARKLSILPIDVNEHTLFVAMAYPDDIRIIHELEIKTGKRLQVYIAGQSDINDSINLSYKSQNQLEENISQIANDVQLNQDHKLELAAKTPVSLSLELMMNQAVRDRASDIHIEPQENKLRIRYRIDGKLHDAYSLPMSVHPALISRIKILSEMNIAEQRRPQDGQFSMKIGNKEIDVRSATMLTAYGERIALRILDKSMSLISFDSLGLLPEQANLFDRVIKNPFGIILVGGPTGSGKTTTLYSFISQFNRYEQNIISIEDPVEYRFPDINQTQVNVKAGLTFATGLRTILRHDPDIVLVGEIRDKDTASIATQAALTGRLVLASIHANDAISVLYRLIDLGIEPYLITASLVAAISQRMVRRICPFCKEEYQPAEDEIAAFLKEMGTIPPKLQIGHGCKMCANTGFRGRVPLFELLPITDSIRRLILVNANASDIKKAALENGMMTMTRDGMLKVQEGITSIKEVVNSTFSVGQ